MAETIQPGDVVKLKSGGPAMTVQAVGNGNARCAWFDAKGEHHVHAFAIASLEK